MEAPTSRTRKPDSVADSPWFWLAIFAGMGLGALLAMGNKYNRRQFQIERQFHARERAQQLRTSPDGAAADAADEPADYVSPGETMIPLWPIQALAFGALCVAVVQLIRRRPRRIPRSPGGGPNHDVVD